MKVRNKITGIVSTERADIANALIRQGLCEKIEEGIRVDEQTGQEYRLPRPGDVPAPAPEEWSVVLTGGLQTDRVLAIQLKVGRAITLYSGHPKFINAKREWQGGCRYIHFGRQVPEAFAREYARRWKANEELRGPYDRGEAPNWDQQAATNRADKERLEAQARWAARIKRTEQLVAAELAAFNAAAQG